MNEVIIEAVDTHMHLFFFMKMGTGMYMSIILLIKLLLG